MRCDLAPQARRQTDQYALQGESEMFDKKIASSLMLIVMVFLCSFFNAGRGKWESKAVKNVDFEGLDVNASATL